MAVQSCFASVSQNSCLCFKAIDMPNMCVASVPHFQKLCHCCGAFPSKRLHLKDAVPLPTFYAHRPGCRICLLCDGHCAHTG
eukprot:1151430-Pelagomonas_calceolata.AAC.1